MSSRPALRTRARSDSTDLLEPPTLSRPTEARTGHRGRVSAAAASRLEVLVPVATAVAFYAVFIARTTVHFAGRTYFSLFDDAMISMRYAQNLAHGHGLVYNAGQHPVEGYTNFLWTLYMAFVHLLPLSTTTTPLAVELTGVLLLIGCGLVVAAIARRLVPGSRAVVALALSGTLFFYPLVFWTLRGMETGLATLAILLLVLQALRLQELPTFKRLALLAALGAMTVLIRDDLIVPTSVVLMYAVVRADRGHRRRVAIVLFGALAASIGAHEAFRIIYYGQALPNTYYLKLSGVSLSARLQRGAYSLANVYTLSLFAPFALATAALARSWRRLDPRLALLGAVVLSLALYVVYVGGDSWEDYRFADRFPDLWRTPADPACDGGASQARRREASSTARGDSRGARGPGCRPAPRHPSEWANALLARR